MHDAVDDNVYSLNIDFTAKDVGSDNDSLTKVLEALVSGDSLLLS
jgi:hypothetical protein